MQLGPPQQSSGTEVPSVLRADDDGWRRAPPPPPLWAPEETLLLMGGWMWAGGCGRGCSAVPDSSRHNCEHAAAAFVVVVVCVWRTTSEVQGLRSRKQV